MKLTATLIRGFEHDQQAYGTKTALFNLLWIKAAEDLKEIGVKHVKTTTQPKR